MKSFRLNVNRRRFLRLAAGAAAGTATVAAVPVWANGDDAATPEADYETGTRLLKNGRSYLKAIAALERATTAKPENAAYQSALGCAYAARFASVCCANRQAARYPANREQYVTRKAKWDAAQTDPRNPKYGRPSPPVPLLPATPDDHVRVPFAWVNKAMQIGEAAAVVAEKAALAKAEMKQILLELGRKSLTAFDAAHRLASALPDEARETVEYERGWGLFLLWREGTEQEIVSEKPLAKTTGPLSKIVVAPADICDAFKICTGINGEQAAYWHSLALAQVPRFVEQSGLGFWGGFVLYPAPVLKVSLAAFDRALALKPRDFDLLFQSAVVMSQIEPKEDALSRLEQAALRSRPNAVLWNLVAMLHFEQFQKAPDDVNKNKCVEKCISAIEQGNRAAGYQKVLFALPAPPTLRAAWAIHPVDGYANDISLLAMMASRTPELTRGASDAAIIRISSALMGVGKKALQSLLTANGEPRIPSPDLLGSEEEIYGRAGMGFTLCSLANQTVNSVQQSRPDAANARLLREFAPTLTWGVAVCEALWDE